jgi:hypothetical protein
MTTPRILAQMLRLVKSLVYSDFATIRDRLQGLFPSLHKQTIRIYLQILLRQDQIRSLYETATQTMLYYVPNSNA